MDENGCCVLFHMDLKLCEINQCSLFSFWFPTVVLCRFWDCIPEPYLMMQCTSNGCWRHLVLMASSRCGDVTEQVSCYRERLSLFCPKLQPIENKAQEDLHILWRKSTPLPIGTRCPLKQIT